MSPSSSSFLFLCLYLLAPLLCRTTIDAAPTSSILQVINCSTSGNYTATGPYAANLNIFLSALPENAISKNGGFYNGTVGEGPDTVYGLALCPADYSRADCGDCLAAAASKDGLLSSCPGSTTVLAMFERCLVRYSDVDFFGTPEIDVVQTVPGERLMTTPTGVYIPLVAHRLSEATAAAEISPQRFSASAGSPYVLVQCTWDLPADKCKQCLDAMSENAMDIFAIRIAGQTKSYSCSVRYSNSSFTVMPFTTASPPSVNQTSTPAAQPSSGSAPTPPSVNQTSTPSSGSRTATVVGAAIAVLAVICLAAIILYMCKFRGQRKKQDPLRYSYRELHFNEEDPLGAGASGIVYKSKVDGTEEHVAIKKITVQKATPSQLLGKDRKQVERDLQEQAMKDFKNEIEVMRPLGHCNIIRLVGWCEDKNNLFLVYELMKNGNLEDQLYPKAVNGIPDAVRHGVTDPGAILILDWQKRHSILIAMATGLDYLHNQSREREVLVHGDIKPSNVMLGNAFQAKLCDFGLVTQFSHEQGSRAMESVRGTIGYVDPALAGTGKQCAENDVYSFGIVLLEVVCSMKPVVAPGGVNTLVQKVRTCYYQGNDILGAADKRLRGPSVDEQLGRVLTAGLLCVQEDKKKRPSIKKVLAWLTTAAQLPALPTENHTAILIPTVNASGPAASTTSHNSSLVNGDEFSTSAMCSPADEDGFSTSVVPPPEASFQTSEC